MPATTRSTTAPDGARIDYTEHHRSGAGRAVVLLAGFGAPATSWLHQVPALVRADHRVVAADLPGHGTAGPTPDGSTMRGRADHLHALLEHLDLHDAVLVGGSMGGNTIWAHVAAHGTGRLAGIAVADQTPKMVNTDDWPHGFYGYTEANRAGFFADGIPDTGHGTPLWRRGLRLVRLLRAMRGARRTLSPADHVLLDDHGAADWRDTVRAVDVPVLFVAGAESELWPASHADASAALSPHGRAVTIPRAGHAVNMEQPAAFDRALLEFLRGLR